MYLKRVTMPLRTLFNSTSHQSFQVFFSFFHQQYNNTPSTDNNLLKNDKMALQFFSSVSAFSRWVKMYWIPNKQQQHMYTKIPFYTNLLSHKDSKTTFKAFEATQKYIRCFHSIFFYNINSHESQLAQNKNEKNKERKNCCGSCHLQKMVLCYITHFDR